MESFDISIFSEIFQFKIIDHIEITLKIIKILVKDFSNTILNKNKSILKEFIYIFFFLEKINQIIILEIFVKILKNVESNFYPLILDIIQEFFELVKNFQENNLFMIFLKRSYFFIKKLKKINYFFKENKFENTLNIFIKNLILHFPNLKFGLLSYLDLLNEKLIFDNFDENQKYKIILNTLEFYHKIDFKFKNKKKKALFKLIRIINNFNLFSNNYIYFLKNYISEQNYFFGFFEKHIEEKKSDKNKNNKISQIEEKNDFELNLKKTFQKKLKRNFIKFFNTIFMNLNEKINNIKLIEVLKFEFILFVIKNYNPKKKNNKIFSIFNLLSFYIENQSEDIKEIYNLSLFFIFRKEKYIKNTEINNLPFKNNIEKKFFFDLRKNIDKNYIQNFKGNWSTILNLYCSFNNKNTKNYLYLNIKNLLTLKLLFELTKLEKLRKKNYFLQINYKNKSKIHFNKNDTFSFLLSKIKKRNKNKKKYIIINNFYYFLEKDKILSLFFSSNIQDEIFIIKSLKFTNKIKKEFFLCLNKFQIFDFINEFHLPIIKNIVKNFYGQDIIKNLSISSKNIIFQILKRNFDFKKRLIIFKNLKKSKLSKQKDKKNLIINRKDNIEKFFSNINYFKNFNNVKVQFENEEGFGIGILREFFFLISQKLKNYKFFEKLNNEYRIKYLYLDDLEKIKEIFFYLGIIFGRVFNQNLIFNFFFTKLFWNFVLNRVI